VISEASTHACVQQWMTKGSLLALMVSWRPLY
jgi:hypothetical protein